jgi:DNA-K related protein
VPVTILGSGRAVVGGSVTAAVSRDDVGALLEEGFLPLVGPGDRPRREQRPGALRELGLPYESDPAITRHLALFLARAAQAGGEPGGGAVRPDAVLFNGGFFAPALARERMVEALTAWGGAAPWVLPVERPEAAVALGAAYYAHLREQTDAMRRLLIKAGSARTYYLGLQEAGGKTGQTAITVLARGVQEGTTAELPERVFSALTNRPVAFPLYSSLVRADPAGEIVQLDPASEDLHRHAPLVTVLRFGKRSRSVEIPVHLSVRFTELGTLELWLQSRDTDHRWRLQFQLRGSQQRDEDDEAEETTAARDEAVVSEQAVAEGERLVHGVFAETPPGGDEANPETLVARLETAFGFGKGAWPLAALRRLADRLLAAADGRRRSPRHEARWLNLTGFCLRPGFGAAADAWRVGEARKVYAAGLAFPRDVQCQVEWLILWQRVAGGFSAGQQRELAQRTVASLGIGARKPPRLNPQIERESWRLLASLERLDRDLRVRIGNELAARVRKEPRDASLLWSLGRLGARRPFYGPLDRSVPPETAEGWLEALLRLPALVPEAAGAVAQIAARTDDAALDVSDATRERAAAALDEAGASRDLIDAVRHARERSDEDAVRYFGERLPEGLRSLTIDD